MRILLLSHAFNSLTQRLYVVLKQDGHDVSIEFDIHDDVAQQAIDLFKPDLIVAPYLKRAIPASIWKKHVCLIVHPGIVGDRGPSALDWAIINQEQRWGVTLLQANAEMDAGDIWATVEFPMRTGSKASIYRNEVSFAALQAVQQAVINFANPDFKAVPLIRQRSSHRGELRPLMQQDVRSIDWQHDDTATVLRKINSADGFPGVKSEWFGRHVFVYDARQASGLSGAAGETLARSGFALCRATRDGAVWIGHVKDKLHHHPFKLPASLIFATESKALTEIPANEGYQEISYAEANGVGYLYFPFYNGAMSSAQCKALRIAYQAATQRNTQVIVLMGGNDFWSNGIHLNMIEAASSAADESWENIQAMNDLSEAIITTTSHMVVAAMQANAGAGGVFLARAADQVWAHEDVILNPHYKDMGNLYGSEYWTYLLPKYCDEQHAKRITQARLPMGVQEACALGLIDMVIEGEKTSFVTQVKQQAVALAQSENMAQRLQQKQQSRLQDEALKPLAAYRDEELCRMKKNFYGFDPSYHVARYNFVYKVCKSRTPLTLANHRSMGANALRRAA
ncbi:hydrogenase maturation protein [Mariprofundus ferrooxydans]|nr:hydrogenase maturation protein [Mariprofundus ferrooxydans]